MKINFMQMTLNIIKLGIYTLNCIIIYSSVDGALKRGTRPNNFKC